MEKLFQEIKNELTQGYAQVKPGNMMRSPAICYSSKVFCFYHNSQMCFKLDKQAPHFKDQFPGSTYLIPFKNKPPMKGWLMVPQEYQNHWKELANHALSHLMNK